MSTRQGSEVELERLIGDGEREGEGERGAGEGERDEQKEEGTGTPTPPITKKKQRIMKWRNIIGFWLLGFCIDYAYFIMLSAAFDIIHNLDAKGDSPSVEGGSGEGSGGGEGVMVVGNVSDDQCVRDVNGSWPGREHCQREGTSLILLADILPLFFMKLTVPFFMNFIPYWIRVLATAVFSLLSFILVGLSVNEGVVILGVVCASISTGFGELTFLSFTSRYDKSTVAALGSGTGFAGVGGTAVYALCKLFLSSSLTLYLQTYIPIVMVIAYFTILGKPGAILPMESESESDLQQRVELESDPQQDDELKQMESESDPTLESERDLEAPFEERVTLIEPAATRSSGRLKSKICRDKVRFFNKEELGYWFSHVKYTPRLWKYMLPLFVVYFAEYAINQSLFELLYNPGTHLGAICIDQRKQYRGLEVMYTVGVFLSRTSVSLFRIRYYWIMAILQLINFVFFFLAACYLFIPSFWLTCFLVLYEGLLGGAVFVNAFYAISKDVPKVHREFSMGIASCADSIGITVAAVLSEWVIHTFICNSFVNTDT